MSTKSLFERGFAFISLPDGRVVVGAGPFRRAEKRPARSLAFYAPDFFLTDPEPWWIPEEVYEFIPTDFLALQDFAQLVRPKITYTAPQLQNFRLSFAELMEMIQGGRLQKAVPVSVEKAELLSSEKNWPLWCTRHALLHAGNLLAYGLISANEGMVGATPELLFSQMNPYHFSTMALAGTKVAEDAAPLLEDAKILHEHQLVIDSLLESLRRFGEPQVSQTRSVFSEHLEHLRTDLEMGLVDAVDFSTWIDLLHPTPALGSVPRGQADDWLKRSLSAKQRERFGAPFAAVWPNGEAYCVVAIRNVQWQEKELEIMAGCGVVAASKCELEWEELRLKRESVKRVLGL